MDIVLVQALVLQKYLIKLFTSIIAISYLITKSVPIKTIIIPIICRVDKFSLKIKKDNNVKI